MSKASALVFLISFVGTLLIGCMNSSAASGGVSQAAFDELAGKFETLTGIVTNQQATITELQTKVAGLETEIAKAKAGGNIVQLSASAGGSGKLRQSAGKSLLPDPENSACAYVGYLPGSAPIYQATSIQCRSTTGYLFALPAPDGGLPLPVDVYFVSGDCTGVAYVHAYSISQYGRAQGAVFTYSDAGQRFRVGYVVPNAELISGTMGSRYDAQGECQSVTTDYTATPALMEVAANDEAITSVSSLPYPGPVVIQ